MTIYISSFSIYKSSQTHVILMARHGVITAGPVHLTIMGMLYVIAHRHTYLLSVTKSMRQPSMDIEYHFLNTFPFFAFKLS